MTTQRRTLRESNKLYTCNVSKWQCIHAEESKNVLPGGFQSPFASGMARRPLPLEYDLDLSYGRSSSL